jgi:hypothetical protein
MAQKTHQSFREESRKDREDLRNALILFRELKSYGAGAEKLMAWLKSEIDILIQSLDARS